MNRIIKIENISETIENDFRIVSTILDGEELWFKLPAKFTFNTSAELFISAILLEAMISNRNIEIASDISISPILLKQLNKLQRIYNCWNHLLAPISIIASNFQEPVAQPGTASFYSGGIDSSYTLLSNLEEITHLIVLSGFDTVEKSEQWPQLVTKHQVVASSLNKNLIYIESNLTAFNDKRKISRSFQHGLTLAGIGISLGFHKVYIPSSFTFSDLFPWGSHPCTDPLWSTGTTTIVHDGADKTRSEKTLAISAVPVVFNNLQVCWKNISYNCGACSKCLRTMTACHLYNLTSTSLPILPSIDALKNLKLSSTAGEPFFDDLIVLAKRQKHPEVAKILRKTQCMFQIKLHFEAFVNLCTFGKFRALVRTKRKVQWTEYRVTLSPKSDD